MRPKAILITRLTCELPLSKGVSTNRVADELAETFRTLAEKEKNPGHCAAWPALLQTAATTPNLAIETFAIGTMFNQVLEAANLRLGPMTANRYQLERDTEGGGVVGEVWEFRSSTFTQEKDAPNRDVVYQRRDLYCRSRAHSGVGGYRRKRERKGFDWTPFSSTKASAAWTQKTALVLWTRF